MLENIDLSRKVSKEKYKEVKDDLEIKLATLQRRAQELKIPVIVVFEGWNAAGKGSLINEMILPLDPRGFKVFSALAPNEEEALRPFLWRFWIRTPARGRLAIFDRSWYRRVLYDRVDKKVLGEALQQSFTDIRAFERQLADDGAVIIKFFLHISKEEQNERFEKLQSNPATAWRVTKDDIKRHKQYRELLSAADEMLAQTDTDYAPWSVVESHDHRFATLKIFNTVIAALERRIASEESDKKPECAPPPAPRMPDSLSISILDSVDLSRALSRKEYETRLKKKQARLRELEHEIYMKRIPVIIVYEGWDAAGKGGSIRRLTQRLDPRGYEVAPIGAPNDLEKSHHYLWRFWNEMPKAGHITIFDRSWYGRVMVERVEGFCTEAEWRRAYREICEMEEHIIHFGAILVKFWLHISPETQLQRFQEREEIAYKQWKITPDDWRNRQKWDAYKTAVEEMLFRTSTPRAPWTIIEAEDKLFTRIKAIDTVIAAIENKLRKDK